jgi:hypothetical protein
MRTTYKWMLCLFVPLLLMQVGCGRSDVAGQCNTDGDCAGERVCVQGACFSPDEIDAGPDAAISCTSDDDCTGGGDPYEDGEMCMTSVCVPDGEGQGVCNPVPADQECPPYLDQDGCSCVPRECSDADDCSPYGCVDGECDMCSDDDDCADDDECAPNGTCVEGQPCQNDRDCPARQICEDEVCIDRPECLLDDDCEDDELCLNGQCTYSPECDKDDDCDDGFECVGGQCYEAICRGADDCAADEVCDAGECVVPPEAASCFVASHQGVISENQQVRLEAFALDGDGNGIPASFEWSSSDPSVASVDADGRYAVGQGGEGTTTITAALASSGTQCDGDVTLTGQTPVDPDSMRVVVVDAESGAAVAGAEVVLSDGSTTTTDSSGVARFADMDSVYDVSVFASDYNWLSVTGVSSSDIRLPLSRKQGSGPVAGFTGEFDLSNINTNGDITLGLAGASIAGGLLDLDLEALLGEPFVTEIAIPGMGGDDVPIPGGLVLFGQVFGFDLDIKETYYAKSAGGARMGWGLAGKVPANRLISMFQGGIDGTGDVLTLLLPMFNRFDHSNQPLNLTAIPRVQDTNDINGNGDTSEMVADYDSFPGVTLAPSVRQNLVTDVDVSNFPQMSGGEAELAVLVGGVLLDAPGYVPMGISATSDEDGDGRPDTRRLTMAPPHGSLAGGRMAVMALAFLPDDVGFSGSIELPDEFSASLWNGQSLPTSVGLGTFPDSSQGSIDDNARSVSVTADAGPMFRVRFVGPERSWDVWSRGPDGAQGTFTHDVSVPDVPGGRSDLFASGDVFVDAISAQVTIDDLVKATGIGLVDTALVATGFNRTRLR